jgi:hypothetical protein
MNELIEKIYSETCLAAGNLDEREFCEKFAELIVAECARVANLTEDYDTGDYKSGRHWASFDIKNRFGVEE